MNGQNIECTSCHDLVSLVNGSTVTLPYVCNNCDHEILRDHDIMRYEPSSEGEPDHEMDNATIENTTLLIADLEQQLAESKQTTADLFDEVNRQQAEIEKLNTRLSAEAEFSDHMRNCFAQLIQARADLRRTLELAARLA